MKGCLLKTISFSHSSRLLSRWVASVFITVVLYFGIEINSTISLQSHGGNILFKARQCVSVIFRGFQIRNLSFLRKAFNIHKFPLFEFNSNIQNLTQVYLVYLLET